MYPASVEYLNRQRIIPSWGGGLWEQRYIYYFPFFSFCECVCVWFCLYSFAFTICPRVLSVRFFLLLKLFFLIFYFNNFILFYLLSFFPPFYSELCGGQALGSPARHQGCATEVGEPSDTGPQETSQLHVISNGENLPEISISTPRPSSTQRPASYSAGYPMPNN